MFAFIESDRIQIDNFCEPMKYSRIRYNVPLHRECLRFSRYPIVSTNEQSGYNLVFGFLNKLGYSTKERVSAK